MALACRGQNHPLLNLILERIITSITKSEKTEKTKYNLLQLSQKRGHFALQRTKKRMKNHRRTKNRNQITKEHRRAIFQLLTHRKKFTLATVKDDVWTIGSDVSANMTSSWLLFNF